MKQLSRFGRAAFVLACAAQAGAAQTTARQLVIVGGALRDDNRAVYTEIVRGRQGAGPLCVLPTASGVPAQALENALAALRAYTAGAGEVVGIDLTTANAARADSAHVALELRSCSGFFFTGGDQSRIIDVFRPAGRATAAYAALLERSRAGAVVAGSSAGAGMMSDPMIAGGSSVRALADGVRRDTAGSGGVLLAPGLPLFESLVDQHFLARGRFARLVVATLALPRASAVGFGIDENTALVVTGEEARVVGASGVVLIDARQATPEAGSHGGTGIRMALLSHGDRYHARSGRITFDPGRAALGHDGPDATAPPDLFDGRALQRWLVAAARTAADPVSVVAGGYRFTLRRDDGFEVRAHDAADPRTFSAGPWRLDVVRH